MIEMLLILISLVFLSVLSVMCLTFATNASNNNESVASYLVGVLGLSGLLGAVIGLILYVTAGWAYLGAEYKASIINKEYGTSYTQTEVFYAESVIDKIKYLDRLRLEEAKKFQDNCKVN